MLLIKHAQFLDKFKLVMFIAVFLFFFVIAFPIYLLPKVLKTDTSEASIKYLENIAKEYPNSRKIVNLLIEKYIKLGFFEKAKVLLLKQPDSFKKYYDYYLIDKQLYYQHRISKEKVRQDLLNMFLYAKSSKDYNLIYKNARMFGFKYVEFYALKYLNRPLEYINSAIALKNYDEAIKVLKQELDKKYNSYYFYQYLNLTLYTHQDKLAYQMAKRFYKKAKGVKLNEEILVVGLKFKDKDLVSYAVKHVSDLNLKLQAYMFLKDYDRAIPIAEKLQEYTLLMQLYIMKKDYKNAAIIAKRLGDYNTLLQIYISQKRYSKALRVAKRLKKYKLVAQIYMIKKDYKNALRYFIIDGFRKNEKVIYSLAYDLKRYDIIKKILKNRVKRGNLKAIKDLNYIFAITHSQKEAESFYNYMYRKTKKDIYLKELFFIYLKERRNYKIKEIAWKFKNLPLNIGLYVGDIYIDEKKYNKAYVLLKKVNTNDYAYLNRMYFLAYKLNKKDDALYYAKLLQNAKRTPQNVMSFFIIYKEINKAKAFEYLRKNYFKRKDFEYWLLKLAYDLHKYRFIINYKNPIAKTPYYYQILINSYQELKMYKQEKRVFKEALSKYPKIFKQQYLSFLVMTKDKEIRKYLKDIKDRTTLYSAYLILGDKTKAMELLKSVAMSSEDIKAWIQYYYLNPDEKLRFYIYKKINEQMLFDREILDFYFYALLKYGSYYKIRKTLQFIKEYNLNYRKYWLIYQNSRREYY